MDGDILPGLARLVHALRHGSDVSAVMLRVLDDAEQAAARIDWSGGGVIATAPAVSAGMTDLPSIGPPTDTTTSLAPPLATDPLAGRTGFWQYPLALDEERWPSPHTAADDGSGRHTRVTAGVGGITLDPVGSGGGGGGALAAVVWGLALYFMSLSARQQYIQQQALLSQMSQASAAAAAPPAPTGDAATGSGDALVNDIVQEMLRWGWRIQLPQARGMVLVAVAVILMYEAYLHFSRKNDQVKAIGAQAGIAKECFDNWTDWFHEEKHSAGRRGNRRGGDYSTRELRRLARDFLAERPRCRGR